MAIEVDTRRGLRRPLELRELVEAVIAAGPADESSWLEWKSTLNLTTSEGAFAVAKAILAFANRMPDQAATTCQGLAYFILGAGAGSAAGTAEIDAADLESYLIKYLGSDGPSWSPTYVTVQETNVLVIVVEAPQWGDPIYTLRATLGVKGGATKGAIFVRSQAKSRPADPGDVDQLLKRHVRGQGPTAISGLTVECEIEKLSGLLIVHPGDAQIERFLNRRKDVLYAQQGDRLPAVGPRREAFDAAIDDHLASCRRVLPQALQRLLIENKFGLVSFRVSHPGNNVLEEVELTIYLDVAHAAYEDDDPPDDLEGLPGPPRLAPPPARPIFPDPMLIKAPSLPRFELPRLRMPDQRIEIDPTSITLDIGRLRTGKPARSTRFFLFLLAPPPEGRDLRLRWMLNSTSTSGNQEGELLLAVQSQEVDLTEFLDIKVASGEDG